MREGLSYLHPQLRKFTQRTQQHILTNVAQVRRSARGFREWQLGIVRKRSGEVNSLLQHVRGVLQPSSMTLKILTLKRGLCILGCCMYDVQKSEKRVK